MQHATNQDCEAAVVLLEVNVVYPLHGDSANGGRVNIKVS